MYGITQHTKKCTNNIYLWQNAKNVTNQVATLKKVNCVNHAKTSRTTEVGIGDGKQVVQEHKTNRIKYN